MRLLRWPLVLIALTITLAGCAQSTATPTAIPTVAVAPTATATLVPPTSTPVATPPPVLSPVSPEESAAAALADLEVPADGRIAVANGEPISIDDYTQYLSLRLIATGQYAVDWSDPANAVERNSLRTQVRDHLINMVLIRQEAAKANIVLNEDQVTEFREEIASRLAGSADAQAWVAFKANSGLDDETFDQIIRESLLLEALAQDVVVLEDVEQVQAAHILVSDEALAAELLERATGGESFADLAEAYSEDPGSAVDGGRLGWFPHGVMVPAFEQAAFALEPGGISDVIATDFGYHIIQVTGHEIRPLEAPYDEMARSQTFNSWFATVRNAAEIEILLPLDAQPESE